MVKIYAHRGGAVTSPENTLAAFRRAAGEGVAAIECDVRLLKDGEIVLFHDAALKRVVGVSGHIKDHTYRQLKDFRVLGKEPIAHLNDLLNFLVTCPKLLCFFDLQEKHPALVERLVEAINRAGIKDRSFVLTFITRRGVLLHAKQIDPGIRIAVMPIIPIGLLDLAQRVGAEAICTGWNNEFGAYTIFRAATGLTDFNGAIRQAQRAGVEVSCGVANTEKDIGWLLDFDIAGIWTDDILLAQRVIRNRFF